MSQFFASVGQSIVASASVLQINIQDWFPLGLTRWISLLVQETLKSLLQHHSLKASILWCSAFFMVQLSHSYVTTGKTIALTILTFIGKVMFLLFNVLSRFAIVFFQGASILESESESHSVVSNSLQPHGLYSLWNSLGQNTGVGRYSLLQEIFPTQRLNPGLPHCRRILYQRNTREALVLFCNCLILRLCLVEIMLSWRRTCSQKSSLLIIIEF